MLLSLFLLPCLFSLSEAKKHEPRMIFSHHGTTMKMTLLPERHAPVQILLEEEPGTVTAVRSRHLVSYNFKNPQTPLQRHVLWKDCTDSETSYTDCHFNISLVHKTEKAGQVFMCGTNSGGTLCCEMNLSERSAVCAASEQTRRIVDSIGKFMIKEGEPSVLVESDEDSVLYVTYSGSQEYVGIHKFGPDRVGPANHNKEQHYVGLLLNKQRENPSQDRVFAFYREKNRDTSLDSRMWIPLVTQVCMADIGGPKKHMQFSWTSQMNARLFCGDPDRKQFFSELVHVATVEADRWQDTRVYGLFRNEWGMSAICVYTIGDIDNVFKNSPLRGESAGSQRNRHRECVADSTRIPLEVLKIIEENSEMEEWVRPVGNSGPIVFNHHQYTHVYVDSSLSKSVYRHPVLFLVLHNGAIHKVTQDQNQAVIIAEYRPFNHSAHEVNIILNPTSKKLYAHSGGELVQVDVLNCDQYGDSCEDCVLARDPYCIWKGPRCVPDTHGTQDLAQEKHATCPQPSKASGSARSNNITLTPMSQFLLRCPVSSLHAEYTWTHPQGVTRCSLSDQQCLFLVDRMGPEKVGAYKCVSEEGEYSKVVALYQVKLGNRAENHSSAPLVWLSLMTVLLALNK
ncbi:semaphorin-7A [Halichoeres trimaculatus]|uniref:semaphorin-7A n=1 Tax=Halichoeres trimaculatus TaxID=147232 RepID=UPI003D9EA80A